MALAVIFGGRSCEHDVSIVTGVQAACELKSRGSLPIYVDTDGNWHTGRDLFSVAGARAGKKLKRVYMRPGSSALYALSGRELAKIDEAVLCCHGAGGEDGSLQGLMELCGVPYTCSGLLPSAVCLDKAEFKARASAMGYPVLPYVVFARAEWNGDICSVADVMFAGLSGSQENAFEEPAIYVLRQAGNLFSIVCCLIVLAYLSGVLVKRDLEEELRYMQYNARQMKQQYEISKDTIDQINIKCHDMRHKVRAMVESGGGSDGSLEEELREAINIYDANIRTGNKTIDVILTEKSLYCEKRGITLSCMVDGEKLDFMREDDLYCLFGNIIDNAAEAVAALPDAERRVINLTCKAHGDMVLVEEENYYDGELTFENGLPLTTKSDRMYHGFGVRSIRMIARMYGGEMTARAEDGVFYLRVLLSSSEKP